MTVLYSYEDAKVRKILVGDLAGLYKIDFTHKRVCYRIIYDIQSEEKILVVYCGIRENVYKRIKRKI